MLTATRFSKNKVRYSSIGIDIGNRSVKMVQLKKQSDGVALHAVTIKEIHEEEASEKPELLIKVLKTLKQNGPFVKRAVISRMPHSQVMIIPTQIPKEEGIEAFLLKEAERHLPYPIKEAVIDYIPMQEKEGEDQKVLLIATQRLKVEEHYTLLREAGFDPEVIDVGPNALLRLFRFIRDIERRVLLINVGRKKTFFTVLWDGNIIIDRQIQWGEDRLVARLAEGLNIDSDEALDMLYTYGLKSQKGAPLFPRAETEILSEDEISNAIFQNTHAELETFAAEAERVLVYCASENRGTMIDQTYLMGGSAYLIGGGPFVKNLYTYLEARLGMNVKMINPVHPFHGSFEGHNNPSLFAVSIGLALRGFDQNGA